MRRALPLALTLLLAAAPAPAQEQAWLWTDGHGGVFISGALEAVPAPRRQSARPIRVSAITQPANAKQTDAPRGAGHAALTFTPGGQDIIVPARFNGSVERNAVVDTGSQVTIITTKLARALGLDLTRAREAWFATAAGPVRAPVVELDSVELGGARMEKLSAVALDFTGKGEVSAIIGMNFLSGFAATVDLGGGRLTLAAPPMQ
ncbi:MAG: clan AA aspartic protease [Nitrospinae bacterium]|nr:clan AA aspartic protease [Nitrospinota bacterium]